MRDDSLAYRADTVVIDESTDWTLPSLPRVPTGELTMQVMHAGNWHRRTPDLKSTGCGSLVHSQFGALRREELKHPLCPVCFTPYELARADALALEEEDP